MLSLNSAENLYLSPSHPDIAQAYYPDLPQLIISLRLGPAPAARAFLLSQEEIHEIEIRIV